MAKNVAICTTALAQRPCRPDETWMATRRKEIEPPSSHPDGSKSFLGGRGQACVPPLPCLRPYHAKVNLIRMEGCDLVNTAWEKSLDDSVLLSGPMTKSQN